MTTTDARPPLIEDSTVDHERDVAAIRQIIADAEKAFNTNDAELLTAPFARNASVVNAMGVQMTGREAIQDANQRGLSGFLRDEHARYRMTDVVFLRPDVAVAHKHAWATTPDGELIDTDHAMVAIYVLVKEDGRWWVAARQNTLVAR
ncbi:MULTISPECIES: SgcJ/EcaC family oxidoreductase [Actinomycetes]|uniref:DUF4440 domain-containing protein n=1 Tax=Streptoalloteichus tenebrarius (strain ATCC 17920 / DSM 40477 / JCM 4838 / CBS 697.72 / NBRC 16177 / NCIMB 11028 / NRRL B-12390 / A12253. 1 / ISP 5477) TaxID=1933 RepID=A0ABT1HSG3_STRSD|nr:SgcJ/EcaC family oxidoreductase [Streptoalloteichus tenebrarius]MCP2258454.1 hypothetical protein [Streptoalloteichus tenebrarius]BFF03625.1 SgcJ/EcaC family oxidoreductase [Streptoalloteichus tenebrarius]GHE84507.1 hypothetical protein GCM10018782_65560 [Streptomyces griseoaurantiacus]